MRKIFCLQCFLDSWPSLSPPLLLVRFLLLQHLYLSLSPLGYSSFFNLSPFSGSSATHHFHILLIIFVCTAFRCILEQFSSKSFYFDIFGCIRPSIQSVSCSILFSLSCALMHLYRFNKFQDRVHFALICFG